MDRLQRAILGYFLADVEVAYSVTQPTQWCYLAFPTLLLIGHRIGLMPQLVVVPCVMNIWNQKPPITKILEIRMISPAKAQLSEWSTNKMVLRLGGDYFATFFEPPRFTVVAEC